MPPYKRKTDPDPEAVTTSAGKTPKVEPPKRKRGRPRKHPLPEPLPEFGADLPEALALASVNKEDEKDEDYVPGKKTATPKKPRRQPARKRATPKKGAVKAAASDDETSAKKATLRKPTPEQDAVKASVDDDEFSTKQASPKEDTPKEEGNSIEEKKDCPQKRDSPVPQPSFEQTLQMSLRSNEQKDIPQEKGSMSPQSSYQHTLHS